MHDGPRTRVNVLFQRYSDSACNWAFAGDGMFNGRLSDDSEQLLRALLRGEKVGYGGVRRYKLGATERR
jgi:hypothetical protein